MTRRRGTGEWAFRRWGGPMNVELPPVTHIVDERGAFCGCEPAAGERVVTVEQLRTARIRPERSCEVCLDVQWGRRRR